MVALKKTFTDTAARLVAAYRLEQDHWTAREMLCAFFESCPNTEVRVTFFTRMQSPDCTAAEVTQHAEIAIHKMVDLGHGAEVEAFLAAQVKARADAEAARPREEARARVRAAVARLARQPDAAAALELVARVVDGLTAAVPLDVSARAALVADLRAALPNRKPARRAVAGIEAALARKGAA